MRLLLIEDDRSWAEALRKDLTQEGHVVDMAHDGADDYLTKPFAFEELVARLRAVTRRGAAPIDEERLVVGDLVMDTRSHEVSRAGKVIDLPPREYALLEFLMRHADQALSRTMILDRVWEYGFDSFANVVDAAILRLRKAVDEGYDRQII